VLFLLAFCVVAGVCIVLAGVLSGTWRVPHPWPACEVAGHADQLLCTLQLLMGVSEMFCGAQLLLEYSCWTSSVGGKRVLQDAAPVLWWERQTGRGVKLGCCRQKWCFGCAGSWF
jgi:hypothetical protein